MAFPYKHVLIIGATAGIGKAMADRLINAGVAVTAVGRRQSRLDEFVQKHGGKGASAMSFDIGKLYRIPEFVRSVMDTHPDIDCVFLNAGVQSTHDFSHPEAVDLNAFNHEIRINFMSFVAITQAALPYLLSKKSETGLIFTGSNIAIIPAFHVPAYSASKAALNAFVLSLRDQLSTTKVKIIEISPPVVQTEIHDYMGEERGRAMGMPLETFIQSAYDGLVAGQDQIIIGSVGPADVFNEIVNKRRAATEDLTKLIRALQ